MLDLDRYVTRSEAAKTLRLSLRQVDRLIKAGDLERVKLSERRTGIPNASLDRYLKSREALSATNQPPEVHGTRCCCYVLKLDQALDVHRFTALEQVLGVQFPGVLVFPHGKEVHIIWAWSLALTPEDVERRLHGFLDPVA